MPYSNSSKCSVLSLCHTILPHDINILTSCLSVHSNVQPHVSVPTLCHSGMSAKFPINFAKIMSSNRNPTMTPTPTTTVLNSRGV